MDLGQSYLLLNAVLYILFCIWCLVAPEATSVSVGLIPQGEKGLAEYFAVYGGLELGIGLFFLIAALKPQYSNAGLLFASCMYFGIVAARSLSLVRNGSDIGLGWALFSLEIALGIGAILLSVRKGIL